MQENDVSSSTRVRGCLPVVFKSTLGTQQLQLKKKKGVALRATLLIGFSDVGDLASFCEQRLLNSFFFFFFVCVCVLVSEASLHFTLHTFHSISVSSYSCLFSPFLLALRRHSRHPFLLLARVLSSAQHSVHVPLSSPLPPHSPDDGAVPPAVHLHCLAQQRGPHISRRHTILLRFLYGFCRCSE